MADDRSKLGQSERQVWNEDLRSLAARLRRVGEEPRKLLASIAELAYSQRNDNREDDTAYVPEILESTGLDVDHFYALLEELKAARLVQVREDYPFEAVMIQAEASGWSALHVVHDFCYGNGISIHEVLAGLRFDLIGMDIDEPDEAAVSGEVDSGDDFLVKLGETVRQARLQRGMARKALAAQSGVSERFVAQIENGSGNASVMVLHDIAKALNVPLTQLIPGTEQSRLAPFADLLRTLDESQQQQAYSLLQKNFGGREKDDRLRRIALVGLRGAGKSTVGALLAKRLRLPFIELGQMIERASGVGLGTVFDLYGQAGFRRFERQCVEELIETKLEFVVATEGGVVSEPDTYDLILENCFTIWLRATPEDHMARVTQQGDLRPMAQSAEAMADMKRILAAREHLYQKADLLIETSGRTIEEVVELVLAGLARNEPDQVSTRETLINVVRG